MPVIHTDGHAIGFRDQRKLRTLVSPSPLKLSCVSEIDTERCDDYSESNTRAHDIFKPQVQFQPGLLHKKVTSVASRRHIAWTEDLDFYDISQHATLSAYGELN